MKKRILIFIFLVITVGGVIFTAFTAYRFSTITDLAIKHSAETVRDIYLYSENKDEALQLIKNMPNIESVDIVDKSTYKKIDKNAPREIIEMAKKEQKFRHFSTYFGQISALIIGIGGLVSTTLLGIYGNACW